MKFSQSTIPKMPITSHGKDLNNAVKKIVDFAYNEDVVSHNEEDGCTFTSTQVCCEDSGYLQSATSNIKNCETEDLKESDCYSIGSNQQDNSKNSCNVSFCDFDVETFAKEVVERKKVEQLNVMLDKNDMSKFFRIVTNQKYSVPINSSCVVINNHFLDHDGKKKKSDEGDCDDISVVVDDNDKLDVLIYIVDDMWHMIHDDLNDRVGGKRMDGCVDGDGYNSLHEKMAHIDLKMTKVEQKLDATLNMFQELLAHITDRKNFDK